MKRSILFFCIFSIPLISNSQSYFPALDSINGNNINALTSLHGDMWNHYNYNDFDNGCEFPSGSGKHVARGTALLLSAYENGSTLHFSYAHYRKGLGPDTTTRIDYWPGPLDNSGNTDIATIDKWAKIWKVTRADINFFNAQGTHTTANTPSSILKWPGKGNQYAEGNNNTALTITEDMAPFFDFNNNGNYEPLLGEYPAIQGKQLLWWIINDNGPLHNSTNDGIPLKVQIEVSAEAFSNGAFMDNIVYYNYKIKNKSGVNYTNVRMGQWIDFDLGNFANDYIGYDSVHRMAYVYNYNAESGGLGNYDGGSPVAGVTFVKVPGDNVNNIVPLGGFRMNFYQWWTHTENAGYWDTAMRTIAPYENECTNSNPAGDRSALIATNDFSLNSGATADIMIALVIADTSSDNVCPLFDSTTIMNVADTAWGNPPNALAVTNLHVGANATHLYPNPANNTITISGNRINAKTELVLLDALGRKHIVPMSVKTKEAVMDIAELPSGVYILTVDGRYSERFLKQ